MSKATGDPDATHTLPNWLNTLIGLQNEVMYVIECIADDFTGEAKSGVRDVALFLDEHSLPAAVDAELRAELEKIRTALQGNQDVRLASRLLQAIRRRLANQIAQRCGQPPPYSGTYYPALGPLH